MLEPRPRRPGVAALLSILVRGLGHVYAGAPRRALGFWLGGLVLALAVYSVLPALPPRLVPPWLVFWPLFIVAVTARDAAQVARRAGTSFVLRGYNRWWVYAGAVFVSGLFVDPGYVRFVRKVVGGAYKLPTTSMEPTLLEGDFLLARRLPLGRGMRGNIVVYRRNGLAFVKRIVGLPGDTLSMQHRELVVNGHPMAEPYASHSGEDELPDTLFRWQRRYLVSGSDTASYHPTQASWGPILVPAASFFLLGDKRGESFDSRYSGFVPSDSIVERPFVVYLSWDSQARQVRWNRIGKAVQ